jgi:hypothetical protein
MMRGYRWRGFARLEEECSAVTGILTDTDYCLETALFTCITAAGGRIWTGSSTFSKVLVPQIRTTEFPFRGVAMLITPGE